MASTFVLPASALLEHWQGHRRLTRRVIEAFPEDQLFRFAIGSMRPFGDMALEMLSIRSDGTSSFTSRMRARAPSAAASASAPPTGPPR